MERLPAPSRIEGLSVTNPKQTRRSFARTPVLRWTVAFGTAIGGIMDAGGSKPPSAPTAQKTEFQSVADAVALIKEELGPQCKVVFVRDEKPMPELKVKKSSPEELACEQAEKPAAPSPEPEENKPWHSFGVAYRWVMRYQEPLETAKSDADIDCNDRSRAACKRLVDSGLHLYYLNLFSIDKPYEPSHQVVMCLVGGQYIIIDHGEKIIVPENMSPQEYFENHHSLRMRIGSYGGAFGVTEFEEPKHEFGPARLWQTALNTVKFNNIEETPITPQLVARISPK
ncbi:MAG TPA: hypothetical protein VI913_02485 [Candidatus Peribacteraceae bacterium]|nr:hypothetical protein [Candidatus Peribacteraceae bacterium]